jgi:hypothetical protein
MHRGVSALAPLTAARGDVEASAGPRSSQAPLSHPSKTNTGAIPEPIGARLNISLGARL